SARPVMMDRLPPFPSDPSSGLGGPAPPHELRASTRIGTEVAGFRIESVLGRGGMSVVYVAEQIRLARKVALKVLTNELAGRFPWLHAPRPFRGVSSRGSV